MCNVLFGICLFSAASSAGGAGPRVSQSPAMYALPLLGDRTDFHNKSILLVWEDLTRIIDNRKCYVDISSVLTQC